MKSLEQVWQQQMRALQQSLSIARRSSINTDIDIARISDASVDQSLDGGSINSHVSRVRYGAETPDEPLSPSLSVVSRLADEFGQRKQFFADDAKFLIELKSGRTQANLNPDKELRRLKQMFEVWKKDFNVRLRDTKVILSKLDEGNREKAKKKWWVRLNSSKIMNTARN